MSSHNPVNTADNHSNQHGRLWKTFLRLSRNAIVFYFVLCLLMILLEPSLIYHPPQPQLSTPQSKQYDAQEVWLQAEDETNLHSWYFAHSQPQTGIVYFHGNGEDAARNMRLMAKLRDRLQASVLILDYRGYGLSEGAPNEAGVISDGIAAQRWLAGKMEIAPHEIVLFGRSIGGAVAVAAAEKLGAKALLLQSTFSDMTDVAAGRFPWLPVRLLMRNRYHSDERIKNYRGPLLQFHGTADRIVPIELAQPLFEAAPGQQKQFVEIAGGGHNDSLPEPCYATILEFLHSVTPAESP